MGQIKSTGLVEMEISIGLRACWDMYSQHLRVCRAPQKGGVCALAAGDLGGVAVQTTDVRHGYGPYIPPKVRHSTHQSPHQLNLTTPPPSPSSHVIKGDPAE